VHILTLEYGACPQQTRDKRDGGTRTLNVTLKSSPRSWVEHITGALSVCVIYSYETNVVRVKSVSNSAALFAFIRCICCPVRCVTLRLALVVHASLRLQSTLTSDFSTGSYVLSTDNAGCLAVVSPESMVVDAVSALTVVRDWSSFWDTSSSRNQVDVASTTTALSRVSVCRVYVAVCS